MRLIVRFLSWLIKVLGVDPMDYPQFLTDDFCRMKCILICIDMFRPLADEIEEMVNKLEAMVEEFNMEFKEDYSEKKYILVEEIQQLNDECKKKVNEYFDQLYLKYYEITDNDILSDIDETLVYLKRMDDKKSEKLIRLFTTYRKILDRSDTNKMMNAIRIN